MRQLAYIHLGVHIRLTSLPSFHGLVRLRRLTLACLPALAELPPLNALASLTRLDLVYLPAIASLPDLTPLTALESFAIISIMPVCCNGFLTGTCDPTHPYCHLTSMSASECLAHDAARATPGTLRVVAQNAASVCQVASFVDADEPTQATVDACNGVLFRECRKPHLDDPTLFGVGICVHMRMQALACSLDPKRIDARRLQIQRKVGRACDPHVEAWLGCQ